MMDKSGIGVVGFVSDQSFLILREWRLSLRFGLILHDHYRSVRLKVFKRIFAAQEFMFQRRAVRTVSGISRFEFHFSLMSKLLWSVAGAAG
jgi:hypothetical protein